LDLLKQGVCTVGRFVARNQANGLESSERPENVSYFSLRGISRDAFYVNGVCSVFRDCELLFPKQTLNCFRQKSVSFAL